jgi:hypothetical protein
MDTRHLRWAKVFSSLIAFCKRRDELLPSDLLAGIYVANLERVSKFWPHPDFFEEFVSEYCDWSEPRWLTWQRWQEETHKEARRWRPFGLRISRRSKPFKDFYFSMFKESPDWQRLFATGEKLTPHRVSFHEKNLPLLTPEVMILTFIRTEDLSI